MRKNMQVSLFKNEIITVKPFLKWAGGKGQLVKEFEIRLPKPILKNKTINNYVEPFLGGGAMFFYLRTHYKIKKAFLFDINRELIVGYSAIKNDHHMLISELCALEEEYLAKKEEDRKEFYYKIRECYNQQMEDFDFENYSNDWVERAKYLIFLNKTCFNGLFRQNQKGGFNVPFGRYTNPTICDKNNISAVNNALKIAEIIEGDFENAENYIEKDSFVYLDPPYRPLNKTSHFTSYSKHGFDDNDQKRLGVFFSKMNDLGAFLMLSNSDPKNEDPNDNFFDNLYSDFIIERVPAKRFINRDSSKRGAINEIIVRNYK